MFTYSMDINWLVFLWSFKPSKSYKYGSRFLQNSIIIMNWKIKLNFKNFGFVIMCVTKTSILFKSLSGIEIQQKIVCSALGIHIFKEF